MTTNILLAVAGLSCLGSLGLLGALFMYRSRGASRGRSGAGAAPVAVKAASGGTDNLPADEAFDEEEMPTVIVNQPTRAAAPLPEKPKTPPRSAGATIIAFDDEDDDD